MDEATVWWKFHFPIFSRFWDIGSKGQKSPILTTVTSKPGQGSLKVIDFGTNGKRVYTFLLVINSNCSPILHRFGDMAA